MNKELLSSSSLMEQRMTPPCRVNQIHTQTLRVDVEEVQLVEAEPAEAAEDKEIPHHKSTPTVVLIA